MCRSPQSLKCRTLRRAERPPPGFCWGHSARRGALGPPGDTRPATQVSAAYSSPPTWATFSARMPAHTAPVPALGGALLDAVPSRHAPVMMTGRGHFRSFEQNLCDISMKGLIYHAPFQCGPIETLDIDT